MVEIEQLVREHGYNAVAEALGKLAPGGAPVGCVRWVSVDEVWPNDYNPNACATPELALLAASVRADGFTQPVVVVREGDRWVVVDGYHRWYVAKSYPDIRERYHGLLPVVVLEKSPNERMASTVRHNRARGRHSVKGMSNLVYQMLENGATDEEICKNLGMEGEELIRLKHVTGIAKLFANHEYGKAWKTRRQVIVEKDWEEKTGKKVPV